MLTPNVAPAPPGAVISTLWSQQRPPLVATHEGKVLVSFTETKTLVLAGAATAAGAAYAARDKIASTARGVAEFVSRHAGRLLGRRAPALAR